MKLPPILDIHKNSRVNSYVFANVHREEIQKYVVPYGSGKAVFACKCLSFNFGHKCTTNESNANHLKSIFNKEI